MNRLLGSAIVLTAALVATAAPVGAGSYSHDPITIHVFYENVIHFTPDDSSLYDTAAVSAMDKGRVIVRTIELERPDHPVKVIAHLGIYPIAKDDRHVHDRWDRAGNLRLSVPGMEDIEVVKFVTAYGGPSEYKVDVSHLLPLFEGECTFKGFVDTWISPGWRMDFSLEYRPVDENGLPDWVDGVFYEESVTEEMMRGGEHRTPVVIPEGTRRVVMHYLVTGHCTDGRGADEFVSKDNVITVDGVEVLRFRPWREDCIQFRTVNPYCARWTDGTWSSDYARSGWCPSDKVDPVRVDLTEYLTPGEHTVGFSVEDIRPKDAEGHFGYWRISSHLMGWK